jgi:ParB/Sulfiredoxin domain
VPKTQSRASPGNRAANRQITVTCRTADSLPLDKIVAFQGELKSLSKPEFEKLKKSIVKFGLSFPSFIWKQNGSAKCLDGHQRSRVLTEMRKEGWKIPEVPVVYVDAKNEKEAKEKILLLSSQYGRYSPESLYEFLTTADLEFADLSSIIDLPQLNMDAFNLNFYGDPNVAGVEAPFLKDGDRPHFQQTTFILHDEQVEKVKVAIHIAKEQGGAKSDLNENSNGNALAWICDAFTRSVS